ncbi:MAG: serine/threonine protein kinase [Proteobacteria bacterium]|nr:serine/threonine protein kinase [Pseudomonadota bacterium]
MHCALGDFEADWRERPAACLDDLEIVALFAGNLESRRAATAREHIDQCGDCRALVAALAHEPMFEDTQSDGGKSESIRASRARYALRRELNRGGMGRILVAYDHNLGTEVALKCLREGRGDSQRFANEIRLMSKLRHPAIMPLQDAGWLDGDFPFFAMPLVRGSRLDQVIAELDPKGRIGLLGNVAAIVDAVSYAHSQGVLHLDIKPQNILIGEFGESILFDWGLGRHTADSDCQGEVTPVADETVQPVAATVVRQLAAGGVAIGTPGYAAPEQLGGAPVDERADIYGLGTVLYHVLTGRPPRTSSGESPPPIECIMPRLPRDLTTVVDRAIADDPAERYARAQELSDDLRRFQSGLLVDVYTYSARERLARFIARNKPACAVGAVALVAVMLIATAAVYRVVGERDTARAARDRAIHERRSTAALGMSLLTDFHIRLRTGNRLEVLGELGDAVTSYLNSLPAEEEHDPPIDAADRLELRARMHELKGDLNRLQGTPRRAVEHYESSQAYFQRVLAVPIGFDRRYRVAYDFCRASLRRGESFVALGDSQRAAREYERLLAMTDAFLPLSKNNRWLEMMVAGELAFATVEQASGELDAAIVRVKRTLARLEALGPFGSTGWYPSSRGLVRMRLGILLREVGEHRAALAAHRTALQLYRSHGADNPKTFSWETLSWLVTELAVTESSAGNQTAATVLLAEAADRIHRALERDPQNPDLFELQARILSLQRRMAPDMIDPWATQQKVVSLRRRVIAVTPGSIAAHRALADDLRALVQMVPSGAHERSDEVCRDWVDALVELDRRSPVEDSVGDEVVAARRTCRALAESQ